MPGHNVAGISIRGMVIVFDALCTSDEMGAKVPETAEAWSSLNFSNQPYGRPDIFCTVFYPFSLFHRNRVVRPLWSLFVPAIYRSGVFGHFTSIAPPRLIGPLLSCVPVFCTGTMWFYRYGHSL